LVAVAVARRAIRLRRGLLDGETIIGGIECRDRLTGVDCLSFIGSGHDDFAGDLERDVDGGVRLNDAARRRGPLPYGRYDRICDHRNDRGVGIVRRAGIGAGATGCRERAEGQSEAPVPRERWARGE
jgi:hypothetical protein